VDGFHAFYVMVYRQIKRFVRARSRVVTMFVQPVLWIFFFGLGMGAVFTFTSSSTDLSKLLPPDLANNPSFARVLPELAKALNDAVNSMIRKQFGGLDYVTFLTTGVVAMTIFLGSFMSGVSVIWDKQFGFLKETLVAPAPRTLVILGRSVGDAIVTLFQATIIALIAKAIAPGINLLGLPLALAYGFIMALGFASAGIAIAVKMNSPEGFQMIMNLLIMPLQFLSGIFFPIDRMPEWAQWIAYVNPLTYAVDGIRYWLTGVSRFNPLLDVALLTGLSAVLIAVASALFEKATIED